MTEVEIKVKIDDINTCISTFLDKGFVREAYVEEKDTYYTSDFYDFKEKDEALRVRESKDLISGKITSSLTYKGQKLDDVSMSRNEIETFVENISVVKTVFEQIGLRSVHPVEKIRIELKKGNVTACIDDVKDLGAFLELEILVKNENMREAALKDIEETLKSIGLNMNATIRKSYLCMIEELQ